MKGSLVVVSLLSLISCSVAIPTSRFNRNHNSSAVSQEWLKLATGPWAGREGAMADSVGDYLYMSGGRALFGVRFRSDVWRTVNGSKWEKVSEGPFPARGYHTMTTLGDCLYVIAGQNFRETYNDVWRSCDGSKSWELVNEAAPFAPRCGHAAVSLPPTNDYPNGTLIVAGGSVEPKRGQRFFFSDVWASHDLGHTWHELVANGSDASFLPCSGLRLVASSNRTLFVVAGERGFTTADQLNHFYRSLDQGATWERLASPAWRPRSGHGVAVYNDTMHVIGGWITDKEIAHDLWTLDLNNLSGSWELADETAYGCNSENCARFDFATAIHSDTLYVLGGSNAITTFGTMFADTWTLPLV